ncbi:hypothetical protein C8J57DRAFT_1310733 [Mycena rebaudengoi]|nr:hypothetical protein C8J57DRAFT_1310733 [Mycena rebaudengoi]
MIIPDSNVSPPPYETSVGQPRGPSKPGLGHRKTEPRYVYYRVYAPDGAIPSKTAPDPTNPLVGRIKATSVPPPLNAASLKRTLAQAEGMADLMGLRSDLYRLPSEQTPLDDAEPMSVHTLGETASTPASALALVYVDELTDEEKQAIPPPSEILANEVSEYVYYRLYTRSGEDISVHAFDPDEPSMGCIDRASIAPPRDALAVKRCIARAEAKPIYALGHLYTDVADEQPIQNEARILTGPAFADFHGATPTDPLCIVQPERRPGLYNMPFKILTAQSGMQFNTENWLQVAAGEIVNTDGIVHMTHMMHANRPAYTAINSNGSEGCKSFCRLYPFFFYSSWYTLCLAPSASSYSVLEIGKFLEGGTNTSSAPETTAGPTDPSMHMNAGAHRQRHTAPFTSAPHLPRPHPHHTAFWGHAPFMTPPMAPHWVPRVPEFSGMPQGLPRSPGFGAAPPTGFGATPPTGFGATPPPGFGVTPPSGFEETAHPEPKSTS